MFDLNQKERMFGFVTSIVYILIGLVFIFVPSDVLLDVIFTILGIIIILLNLVPCIYYFMLGKDNNRYYTYAVLSLVSIAIGFAFIFMHNAVLAVILGSWLVVLPIVRIVLSNDKKAELKKSIPYFVVAILLFFIPANTIFDIVLKVFGGLLIALGVFGIIYRIVIDHKNNKNDNDDSNNQNREIIDVEYKEL